MEQPNRLRSEQIAPIKRQMEVKKFDLQGHCKRYGESMGLTRVKNV
jgi:hypothetical protein